MHLQRLAAGAVLLSVLCGAGGLALRYRARAEAQLAPGDTAWRVTYAVECEARRAGAVLRIAAPADTPYCRVFRQDFRQQNLRMDPRGQPRSASREIVAIAEQPGWCESLLRFDLHLNPRGHWVANGSPAALAASERARYLVANDEIQMGDEAVTTALAALRMGTADEGTLVARVFDYCLREIDSRDDDEADDAAAAIRERRASPRGCTRAMIALCRAAGVPARPVIGFILAPGDRGGLVEWAEVWLDGHWTAYDPVRGYAGSLPYNMLPARRGEDRLAIGAEADEVEVEYSIVQLPRAALGAAAANDGPAAILDLTRLPLEMQRDFSLLLLMPLGALLTCVFRNIIGLKTSGTFTPTLLALSFVFADWQTGLAVVLAAFVLGVAGRCVIDGLKLLILPRLSIMLTLVVFSIIYGISTLHYLQVAPRSETILLPMVILTMLVERFYLTTQEGGTAAALEHLAGTAVVGFFCYLILRWETVARLLLAYPEAHFFTVAAMVLIGRYTGYQLLEAWRFRDAVDFMGAQRP